MIIVDYAIEHPVAFLAICGALITIGWSAHTTRRLSQQTPAARCRGHRVPTERGMSQKPPYRTPDKRRLTHE